MDEIDNIILHSLRQIGCTLDEEVTSLDEFSPTLLVQVVSKCITLIDPSLDLPRTLPPGMAQRFTATASLAEACRIFASLLPSPSAARSPLPAAPTRHTPVRPDCAKVASLAVQRRHGQRHPFETLLLTFGHRPPDLGPLADHVHLGP
ncbi:coiled-coil domain-containing protein 22 homolog [Culex pipiens pallens]|uniref:coiled-coil domain-containing protein 22 homolog n=1 Tax=Culex pipiens pallens TaxID=42434 RepID=UPI0022AA23FC|nr:coiled-coil domain-containing protein 22 homolog [Culex pipiens pallens]